MTNNNTPVVERGLAKTDEFFNSPAFQKYYEKEKREDMHNNIKPGLTDAEIDELVKLCNERFGCSPPQGWLILLKIMNGFFRIDEYTHPDQEKSNFFYCNNYNLENGYYCDDEGKLKYLMIGWEDESYYGYNFQTGKYAELSNMCGDEHKIFHSFADVFLNMMYYDGWADEMDAFFHDFLERYNEEDRRFCNEQIALGDRYCNGDGVEQDYSLAEYHYREAAEKESGEAQYKLGLCYANGYGVKQSVWEAAFWFSRAARQGHTQAQLSMADCYQHGTGVTKDKKKAAYWRKKANENTAGL